MPHMNISKVLPALAVLAAMSAAAIADDFKAGALTVAAPWARATIGEGTNSAAYMKIENSGDTPDKLMAVKTDAAENVSLHESRMDGSVMKMVPVGSVDVPAHGSAVLKPLGLHVMLLGLKKPLTVGESLPLTLVFEKQGEVAITATVGQAAPK
jgi:periplasmic copper chaperone A